MFGIGVLTWPVLKVVPLNQIIYTASVSAAAGLRSQAAPARPWEGLPPSFDTKVSGNADPIRFLGSVAFISITHLPVRELNRARFLAAFPKQLHPSLLITFSLSSFQETQVWTSENNCITSFQKTRLEGCGCESMYLARVRPGFHPGIQTTTKPYWGLGSRPKYRNTDIYRTSKIREIFNFCR